MSCASSNSILVVDDDRTIRHLLLSALLEEEFEVDLALNAADCIAAIGERRPELLLLDLNLPDGSGIDLLRQIRSVDQSLPIVLITAEGDSESAILAARHGAQEYLTKPLDLGRLRDVVRRTLTPRPSSSEPKDVANAIVPEPSEDNFVGRSREMQAVFKGIGRVATESVSVLICGESGTGKELVARAIWEHSNRSHETFLAVNCAAMSTDLLESELFGHEQGAFTGADRRHIGKFEVCDRGTLFLDEVGDMHPAMQAKLLRVLQEHCFSRVGGDALIRSNARILAATNRDLKAMCQSGAFREDLFHRLNGFSISVPPLRNRGDDIRLLLGHFLHRYNQKLNKQLEAISAEAAEILVRYAWPGNVRELESLLSQAMLNAHGQIIDVPDLPSYVSQRSTTPAEPQESIDPPPQEIGAETFETFVDALLAGPSDQIYSDALEYMERHLLERTLQETSGNQSAAARRLGITRGSLRFKLRQLGIRIQNQVKVSQLSEAN